MLGLPVYIHTYIYFFLFFFQKPFICGSLTWTHGASPGLFQRIERLVLEPCVKFYPNPLMMSFYYKNYGFETTTSSSHQHHYLMPLILGSSIQAAQATSCPWAVQASPYWAGTPLWTWSSPPSNWGAVFGALMEKYLFKRALPELEYAWKESTLISSPLTWSPILLIPTGKIVRSGTPKPQKWWNIWPRLMPMSRFLLEIATFYR